MILIRSKGGDLMIRDLLHRLYSFHEKKDAHSLDEVDPSSIYK